MISISKYTRVYGIDWLEVFANEEPGIDYSPDGYRRRGWYVEERGYGTKTMSQMFKLLDRGGNPFVEIRRAPRYTGQDGKFSVYKPGDCYIRFDNMYCYDSNPMSLMMEFLEREHISFKKIYRIDLFLDLYKFDTNDDPVDVMRRIVTHRYVKINQTRRRLSGDDKWDGCEDNWIAWGAEGSMVGTKFYNKTKELRDTKMKKPWIVEQWRRAGFIDNPYTLSFENAERNIWRLEFALKSSAKGWISSSRDEEEQGIKYRLEHKPEIYMHHQGILNAIVNLIPHYFQFKIYEEGKTKYECQDKELFRFAKAEAETGYRLTSESDIDRVRAVQLQSERAALYHLLKAKNNLYEVSELQAINQIIANLNEKLSILYNRVYTKRTDIF